MAHTKKSINAFLNNFNTERNFLKIILQKGA